MEEHKCICCNYNAKTKSNYNKHINTKKHKRLNGEIIEQQSKVHSCNFCKKIYSCRQSLHFHKKSCSKKKLDYNMHNNTNNNIENNIEKLKEELRKLEKRIENITNSNINNNIIEECFTNDMNNLTNIKNNQTININCYSKTDDSHIKHEDLLDIVSNYSYDGITKLLQIRHINPNKPENMNVFIKNMKHNYIHVLQDDEWHIVNFKEQIDIMCTDLLNIFQNWFTKDECALSPCNKEKYKRMIIHIEKNYVQIKKKIVELLYNNRKVIIENKNKNTKK